MNDGFLKTLNDAIEHFSTSADHPLGNWVKTGYITESGIPTYGTHCKLKKDIDDLREGLINLRKQIEKTKNKKFNKISLVCVGDHNSHPCLQRLENEINEYIEQGYMLFGSIIYKKDKTSSLPVQYMIKERDDY